MCTKNSQKEQGRARDRTGIARIRIWSDDHYTTQPELLCQQMLNCKPCVEIRKE